MYTEQNEAKMCTGTLTDKEGYELAQLKEEHEMVEAEVQEEMAIIAEEQWGNLEDFEPNPEVDNSEYLSIEVGEGVKLNGYDIFSREVRYIRMDWYQKKIRLAVYSWDDCLSVEDYGSVEQAIKSLESIQLV